MEITLPLAQLSDLADRLVDLAAGHPDLIDRAATIGGRTRSTQFHVAVVGEFKRGKSTLINALLGVDALPTGVLPLTAIATEVAYGPLGAQVTCRDDGDRRIPLAELRTWATEEGNPDNHRGVIRVCVQVPAPLLASGLVLVDTPGSGSVHTHNTTAAESAWDDADGAIIVLGADAPLSEVERDLLRRFIGRQAPVFVVLNKADHLEAADLEVVRRFVIESSGQPRLRLWAVSARAGLPGRSGHPGELASFKAALEDFVDHDLIDQRRRVTANELVAVGQRLRTRTTLKAATAELEVGRLQELLSKFGDAAAIERDRFTADQILLGRRTDELAAVIADRLDETLGHAAGQRVADIAEAATTLPVAGLEAQLRDLVEAVVREELERLRPGAVTDADRAWASLAENFTAAATRRLDTIRTAAEELFAVALPPVSIPSVSYTPDTFTFLFRVPPSEADPVALASRRLIPNRVRRRRAASSATQDLVRELAKHGGRARVDLRERLTTTRHHYVTTMSAHFEEAVADIDQATEQLESTADRTGRATAKVVAEATRLRAAVENLLAEIDAVSVEGERACDLHNTTEGAHG